MAEWFLGQKKEIRKQFLQFDWTKLKGSELVFTVISTWDKSLFKAMISSFWILRRARKYHSGPESQTTST